MKQTLITLLALFALSFAPAEVSAQSKAKPTTSKPAAKTTTSKPATTAVLKDSLGNIIARRTSNNMILVGTGANVRAMNYFSNSKQCLSSYARVARLYSRTFGPDVHVYSMPIPTACQFYAKNGIEKWSNSQRPALDYCREQVGDSATFVDIEPVLAAHADEDIYSRTDHHWAPLGAYYAAMEFARTAGVPFLPLANYDAHEIKNFVGTMPMFAKAPEVKNAPETFIYYTPRDVKYTATFIDYTLDSSRKNVVSASAPHEGPFFRPFPDGSSAAYSTFMGGDCRVVDVVTSTKNGRHLLILKDSFGNALPAFLFGSFESIHVVDCRYFTMNLVDYAHEKGITDILFANNMEHAAAAVTTNSYERYLTQKKK